MLWWCCTTLPAFAASLQVQTSADQVEMGKYLSATLVYRGDADPGTVNLESWQDDFVLESLDRQVETLSAGMIQIRERWRLYPRGVGPRVLDAIALGGAFALPISIQVLPAVRGGIDATPGLLPFPRRFWRGEAREISVRVPLLHPGNEVRAETLQVPGLLVRRLPDVLSSRDGVASITLRWRLQAKRPGWYSFELPAIVQRGRGRWKFYLPIQQLHVRPLPAYLPATLMVGKPGLQVRVDEAGETVRWQLSLSSDASLPPEIHGLRRALAGIAAVAPEQVILQARQYRHEYSVPVPAWSWGWGKGPVFTLEYFDTDAGRAERLPVHLPALWRIPFPAQILLLSLLAAAGVWLLWRIGALVRRWRALRRFRRQLLQTKDAQALRRCLLQSVGVLTLRAWAARQPAKEARWIADELNALCFSQDCSRSLDTLHDALRSLPMPPPAGPGQFPQSSSSRWSRPQR